MRRFEEDDKLIFENTHALPFGIMGVSFVCFGVFFLFLALMVSSETSDGSGLAFALVFGIPALILIAMGISTIVLVIRSYNNKFYLDKHGIHSLSSKREIHIPWSEIGDYGVSFSGEVRSRSKYHRGLHVANSYTLYFSKTEIPLKDSLTKSFEDSGTIITRGYNILITSTGRYGYFEARQSGEELRSILTFCEGKTKINPFIPQAAKEDIFI